MNNALDCKTIWEDDVVLGEVSRNDEASDTRTSVRCPKRVAGRRGMKFNIAVPTPQGLICVQEAKEEA